MPPSFCGIGTELLGVYAIGLLRTLYKEAPMKILYDQSLIIASGVCAVMSIAGCIGAPAVVQPSCSISWDGTPDWRIAEYRVTAGMIKEGAQVSKITHKVKAPATQVSCQEIGAQAEGIWQVTIEACLKDETCSPPSKPISFKVVNR